MCLPSDHSLHGQITLPNSQRSTLSIVNYDHSNSRAMIELVFLGGIGTDTGGCWMYMGGNICSVWKTHAVVKSQKRELAGREGVAKIPTNQPRCSYQHAIRYHNRFIIFRLPARGAARPHHVSKARCGPPPEGSLKTKFARLCSVGYV